MGPKIFTQIDLEHRVAAVVRRERSATAQLLEDPGVPNRCRVIAAVLGDGEDPVAIQGMLERGSLPTDLSVADKLAARRSRAAPDPWAKAYDSAQLGQMATTRAR